MDLSQDTEYHILHGLVLCFQWYIALSLVYSVYIIYDIFRKLVSETYRLKMKGHYYDEDNDYYSD